jgi:hypothetical protein
MIIADQKLGRDGYINYPVSSRLGKKRIKISFVPLSLTLSPRRRN